MSTTSSTQIDDLTGRITLHVENGKGRVDVTTAETTSATVDLDGERVDDVRVDLVGDVLHVVAPHRTTRILGGDRSIDMVIVVPDNTHLSAELGSSDLVVRGTVGAAKVKSGSGDISLDNITEPAVVRTGSGDIAITAAEDNLKVQTGSGDISLGTTSGAVSVSTGSGDVTIAETAAPTVVKTGSGDLEITSVHGDASFTTGSGDVDIRQAVRGRVTTKSASGEVQIGVRAGVPVWTDVHTVSGRIRSTLQGAGQPEDGQDHLELRATTVSGDIVLTEV